jgi:hypothetical protein
MDAASSSQTFVRDSAFRPDAGEIQEKGVEGLAEVRGVLRDRAVW